MIVRIKKNVEKNKIKDFVKKYEELGFHIEKIVGEVDIVLGFIGDTSTLDARDLDSYDFVESAVRISEPYKKVNRKFHLEDTIIDVDGIKIGGKQFTVIAGPCSVESYDQIMNIADSVKSSGAHMYRGGAYKPRTSPYSFQGMRLEGLKLLKEQKNKYNLPIVSEIMSVNDIDTFVEYVDIFQVGARNMQNFDLLKELGKVDKPILLKRGFSNTIEEWLMSAEYIMAHGNRNVILCERGIRTFEKYTRNTLDLSAVAIVKKISHLPIIVDPSHAVGKWEYVEQLSKAALAVGADGIIVEVHNDPINALSDGRQSLKPATFKSLMDTLKRIAPVFDKEI
ncbi:3-deoxy-7-phosphoheptulonate synthase [Candidatus Izimaplasma bacterium]|nr:3-deoxy-7-phosphoheptulonate synthase [Candidatus Izimaplasma bacterium]